MLPWGLLQGTGTSLMKLEFLAVVTTGTSTEQEVGRWYFCTEGEVEQVESTVVLYLGKRSFIIFTLECIQLVLVGVLRGELSNNVIFH